MFRFVLRFKVLINGFVFHVLPDKRMRGCGRSRRISLVLRRSTTTTCESFQTLTSPPAHRSPSMTLEEATACPTGAHTPASAVVTVTRLAHTRTIILPFPTRAKPWRSWNAVQLLTKLRPWKSDWYELFHLFFFTFFSPVFTDQISCMKNHITT